MRKYEMYVVGFMFSTDHKRVALIRKTHPDWQKGKRNGVGGKINLGECGIEAMVREFKEETGAVTRAGQWKLFATLSGGDGDIGRFELVCYATVGDLSALRTTTDEEIEVVKTESITPLRRDVVENLTWLVPLALDCMDDNRPFAVEALYP